jgi:hypothetical protein
MEQWFRVIWATTAGIVAMTAFGAGITLLGVDATSGPQARSVPLGLYVFLALVFLVGAYAFVAALADSPRLPLPGAGASRRRALQADEEAALKESLQHSALTDLETAVQATADAVRGVPETPPFDAPLDYQIDQARLVLGQVHILGETFDSHEFAVVWERTRRDDVNAMYEPLAWEIVVLEALPELARRGELDQMENGKWRFRPGS